MDSQLLIDNFIETVLDPDEETVNYNGEEVPFPSLPQCELNHQFILNLKKNISPDEFEKNIEKALINIKYDLEHRYKIYFFLIYNICYLRQIKINHSKINELDLEFLNELLLSDEKKIINFYKTIKKISLN